MAMPLLDRIRTSGANPATESKWTNWAQWPWTSSKSLTGLTMSTEKALGLTAAYRGVTLLASLIGQLPIDIYSKAADGSRVDAADASNRWLWLRPNLEMTRQTFWECTVGQEVLGNGFIWVEKDADGGIAEIWPIEQDRMKVGRLKNGTKVYQIDGELPMIDYRQGGEILHIPNYSKNGLVGYNPFKLASEALAIGLSAQEYAARYYSQADSPPGYLSSEMMLTPEQAGAISDLWHKQRAGLQKAHRMAVVGGGAKFLTTGIDPNSAQLHEAREFSVVEVGRLLGLPPALLGDMDHASQGGGNGVEEMNRSLMTYTGNAHATRFEQAVDDALLVRELSGRYMKFNLSALLKGNTLARYQAYALGYGRWLTPNDIRRSEDMAGIEGGDVLPAANNLVPIEQLGATQPGGGTGGRQTGGTA